MNKKLAIECIKTQMQFVDEMTKDAFRMAVKVLEDNPSESPNGWKPVSKDTNPSKSGWYIVTCSEEMTASNERFSSIAEYDATTGEWFDMDEPTDCYLAYMPLPAPYQPRRMNHES